MFFFLTRDQEALGWNLWEGGGRKEPVLPRNLETMAVSSSSSQGSPQLARSAALLAHPVHLEDHWIGNNTLPASPLLPPGTHLVSASHPLKGTQSARETEGSMEQRRSEKAIKELVSELEAERWGAGWSRSWLGGEMGAEKGPNLLTSKQQPGPWVCDSE